MAIKHFISLLIILTTLNISSQICEGSLGDNIFIEGDFGSGMPNVVLDDPNIAPGYTYTTAIPPDDGFYTITNDMTEWNFAFGWLEILDNSSDDNGYMMIVNASFDTGLFYEKVIDNLCENTLYVFSVDIYNLIVPGTDIIKPNVSFLIDDIVEYNSGDIQETASWETYGFTFMTNAGQTSVKLSLRNNAPGGIGNDLALDNITFKACGPEADIFPDEEINECADGSVVNLEANIIGNQYSTPVIQWQTSTNEGNTWVDIPGETEVIYSHENMMFGNYYYRYLIANDPINLLNSNCRVISNTKIINVVPLFFEIKDTICEGLTYNLGDRELTDTGLYLDTLISSVGCDSVITLDLFFITDPDIQLDISSSDPNCSYLTDGIISIDNITNGQAPYNIEISDADFLTEYVAEFLEEGNYSIILTDRYGCQKDTTISLISPNAFSIELGNDLNIELGDQVNIVAESQDPISGYIWSADSYSVECIDCESLETTVPNDSYIYLSASSDNGCVDTDSIFVSVETIYKVFLPNIISTTENNINSQFSVFTKEGNAKLIQAIRIYDRWGNKVYELLDTIPNSPDISWNGTFSNQALEIGIYTYAVTIQHADDEVITYTGTIQLIY